MANKTSVNHVSARGIRIGRVNFKLMGHELSTKSQIRRREQSGGRVIFFRDMKDGISLMTNVSFNSRYGFDLFIPIDYCSQVVQLWEDSVFLCKRNHIAIANVFFLFGNGYLWPFRKGFSFIL